MQETSQQSVEGIGVSAEKLVQFEALFAKTCTALSQQKNAPPQISGQIDVGKLQSMALEIAKKLVSIYAASGRYGDGVVTLDRVSKHVSADVEIAMARAALAEAEGALDDAAQHYLTVARSGLHADKLLIAGRRFAEKHAFQPALLVLALHHELRPESAEGLRLLAYVQMQLQNHETAMALWQKAYAIEPRNAVVLNGLFACAQFLGAIEDAERYALEIVEYFPEDVGSYNLLNKVIKKFTIGHPAVAALEKAFQKAEPNSRERALGGFLLYKVYEDLGRFDEAFDMLDEANHIMRAALPYSRADEERQSEAIMSTFDTPHRFAADSNASDAQPIFIVGLPRTGSSLTEQILASHRHVFGGGEMGLVGHTIRRHFMNAADRAKGGLDLSSMTAQRLAAVGREIADEHGRVAGGKARLADKQLFNFKWIGLIKAMLPNAKIVHVSRAPAATCLANYSSVFGSDVVRFIYDLEDVAAYYVMQQRMMDHWHALYPGEILELPYEALVADQRGETERLLAYCELDWDDSCLDFHETERVVTTTSSAQVRQAIYSGANRKVLNYMSRMEPAFAILRAAGIDPQSKL